MDKKQRHKLHATSELKRRYKMYKSGKQWVVAGIMFIGMGTAFLGGNNKVFASTDAETSDVDTAQTGVAVNTDKVVPLQSSVKTDTASEDAAQPVTPTADSDKDLAQAGQDLSAMTPTEATASADVAADSDKTNDVEEADKAATAETTTNLHESIAADTSSAAAAPQVEDETKAAAENALAKTAPETTTEENATADAAAADKTSDKQDAQLAPADSDSDDATRKGSPTTKSAKNDQTTTPESTTMTDLNSLFPATDWAESDFNASISIKTTNGKDVVLKAVPEADAIASGLYGATVTIDGKKYTYAFSGGSTKTSVFYMMTDKEAAGVPYVSDGSKPGETAAAAGALVNSAKILKSSTATIYTNKVGKDEKPTKMAKVFKTDDGIWVADQVELTTAGEIKHTVTFLNTGDAKKNIVLGSHLDTAITGGTIRGVAGDEVTIHGDGKGGAYITSDKYGKTDNPSAITLYLDPGEGTYAYATAHGVVGSDEYSGANYSLGNNLIGKGDYLLFGVALVGRNAVGATTALDGVSEGSPVWPTTPDSSFNYQTGLIANFATGDKVTMTYVERLAGPTEVAVHINYVDADTGDAIGLPQTIVGIEGDPISFKNTTDWINDAEKKEAFDGYTPIEDSTSSLMNTKFVKGMAAEYTVKLAKRVVTQETTTVSQQVTYTTDGQDPVTETIGSPVTLYRAKITAADKSVSYTPWTTDEAAAKAAETAPKTTGTTIDALTQEQIDAKKPANHDATVTSTKVPGQADLTGADANKVVTITSDMLANLTADQLKAGITVTRTVNYANQAATLNIKYLDADDGNKELTTLAATDTTTFHQGDQGHYQATLTGDLAKKYELAPDSQQSRLDYDFSSTDTATVSVLLKHKIVTTEAPSDEADPNYDVTHKTATVKVLLDTSKLTDSEKAAAQKIADAAKATGDTGKIADNMFGDAQEVYTYKRNISTDMATGKTTYGVWTQDHDEDPFTSFDWDSATFVPVIGYDINPNDGKMIAASSKVTFKSDKETFEGVMGGGTDNATTLWNHVKNEPEDTDTVWTTTYAYAPKTLTATVKYVDTATGKEVANSAGQASGQINTSVDYTLAMPDGYELATGDGVSNPTITDGKIKITITADTTDDVTINVKKAVRTLQVTYVDIDPAATPATKAEVAQLSGTVEMAVGDKGPFVPTLSEKLANKFSVNIASSSLDYDFTDANTKQASVTVNLLHKLVTKTAPTDKADSDYALTHMVATITVLLDKSALNEQQIAEGEAIDKNPDYKIRRSFHDQSEKFTYMRSFTTDMATGAKRYGHWQNDHDEEIPTEDHPLEYQFNWFGEDFAAITGFKIVPYEGYNPNDSILDFVSKTGDTFTGSISETLGGRDGSHVLWTYIRESLDKETDPLKLKTTWTAKFTYVPLEQTATVTYKEDGQTKPLKVDSVKGNTNEVKDYTVALPDGYQLDADATNPTIKDGKIGITMAADDSDNQTIYLERKKAELIVNYVDVDPHATDATKAEIDTLDTTIAKNFGEKGAYSASLQNLASKYQIQKAAGENYDFTDPDNLTSTVTVNVLHKTQTPAVPDKGQPGYDETHKTLTLNVAVDNTAVDAANKANAKLVDAAKGSQSFDFERQVTIDAATGLAVDFGEWTPSSKTDFADVAALT
ncbi:KxYKxGKxW signal peptide domain-containing protein [Lacticaseibacillus hulanensis]|uniref:KxYKxGKxW signal peptide domain-containing protein n=1 Tax=Lacticaseibacillus hulanensis TaxID=2493111 RepID=UPI000FDC99C6|nr:KxYKxGKxW signal peptide domain-containing protein [Lacticaseibacillus hulanensis]